MATVPASPSNPPEYKINFLGDVMLGRLIDQLLPNHVNEPSERQIIESFAASRPQLRKYGAESPWGNTMPLLRASDLNIMNLETSATTHERKWPDKVFNYRMHPKNVAASLKPAQIDYVSLANNHTLDFCEKGLKETIDALNEAGIAFAGAGHTRDEALGPAVLHLPRYSPSEGYGRQHTVHVYSAADHPADWSHIPLFHHIDYSMATRASLKRLLNAAPPPSLKVLSVHWGPNYSWLPATEIRALAHFSIDECGVDVVHGHSSHHMQGVEVYKKKLIIYGCGDFVDDYAVVRGGWRNDLSGVWRVVFGEDDNQTLIMKRLEIFPTRIKHFQAERLQVSDSDHRYTTEKLRELSKEFGTVIRQELGPDGQLVIGFPGI